MKRLLSLLIIIVLTIPKTVFALSSEQRINVSETVTYVAEVNPLTGNCTLEYKSTITVSNDGKSAVEYRFIQRLFKVDASTLELPKEAKVLDYSGDFCLIEWDIQANPGTSIFEIRGRPLWTPLSINIDVRVNDTKPKYSSAYGVFFVESEEGNDVEWRIRLRNNNPILLDPLTNVSSKPPLFVSISITLPGKYFREITYDPPANMTSMLEKDTVSWMFILKGDAEINIKAAIRAFDDWGTIPLTPISISFSPMEDSIRESITSQLKSLNMSIGMMETFLLPLSNFTSFIDLMKSILGNLSYALESTGNQTIFISDTLKTIGFQLSYASSQLSQAASMLSTAVEEISKVDFQRIKQILKSSRETAYSVLNLTLRIIADAENDLLEIKGILTDLRSGLTDPNQIALVDRAIERIDSLYNRLRNIKSQVESAGSQIDSLFNGIESFFKMIEEYRSKMVNMGSGLSTGVSALSQVSSALSEVSSALRLIGEANIMMGGNMTSVIPLLENASSSLSSIEEGLEGNATSLKKAYDELSTFLRLMDYNGNKTRLMAPEIDYGNNIIFRPVLTEYDGLLRLDSLLFDNSTRIGVRVIKVYYSGAFEGVLLNTSRVLRDLSELGIEVSENSVTISQFRLHDKGNVLTLWNGQDFSLLFSNNSQITVYVDYSIMDNLGDRSETISYSIIQPTLGKGFNIILKPGEETPPLKTGLNMLMISLLAVSVIAILVLLYVFGRKREIIIV